MIFLATNNITLLKISPNKTYIYESVHDTQQYLWKDPNNIKHAHLKALTIQKLKSLTNQINITNIGKNNGLRTYTYKQYLPFMKMQRKNEFK